MAGPRNLQLFSVGWSWSGQNNSTTQDAIAVAQNGRWFLLYFTWRDSKTFFGTKSDLAHLQDGDLIWLNLGVPRPISDLGCCPLLLLPCQIASGIQVVFRAPSDYKTAEGTETTRNMIGNEHQQMRKWFYVKLTPSGKLVKKKILNGKADVARWSPERIFSFYSNSSYQKALSMQSPMSGVGGSSRGCWFWWFWQWSISTMITK